LQKNAGNCIKRRIRKKKPYARYYTRGVREGKKSRVWKGRGDHSIRGISVEERKTGDQGLVDASSIGAPELYMLGKDFQIGGGKRVKRTQTAGGSGT